MNDLTHFLRGYDAQTLARARAYVRDGRVTSVRKDGDSFSAFVDGTSRYAVMLAQLETGDIVTDCTCMAYARFARCKHLAALVCELQRSAVTPDLSMTPVPAVFRGAYSASRFFERLSLYAGVRLGDGVDRWVPLGDFWRRAARLPTEHGAALCERALAHAPEIARELDLLRTWTPPDAPLPQAAFGQLYAKLADDYVAHRKSVKIGLGPPGPIDDPRHPGFSFDYDEKLRRLVVRENASSLLSRPERLSLTIPLVPGAEPHFEQGLLPSHGDVDASTLFALRALLLALHERTDEALKSLERALARPVWDHVLEQLGARVAAASREPREWAFCLQPLHPGLDGFFRLVACARRPPGANGKPQKWKAQKLEALYAEEVAPVAREIARAAMLGLDPRGTRVELGTPHGHEVLRLLAQHPLTCLSPRDKIDPDVDPRAEIVTGDVTMTMDRGPSGDLIPRFVVGSKEIAASLLRGGDGGDGAFRAMRRGDTIVSAFVPPALRPWLAAAEKMGAALAFPPEASSKLVATAEPLVAAGVVRIPRDALGAELNAEPKAALRVEWRKEGAAVVQIFVAPCPGAPLVAPGLGPKLLTFEHAGRRVFVERDLERERPLAGEVRDRIAAPILWADLTGRTDGLEDALVLADWLDRNPLGLAIEVTVGRPPAIASISDVARSLEVRLEGSWLVLDGELDVEGVKLTVGDVLEAARLARRYVPAGEGLFLELSKEAIATLQPVAIASELVEGDGEVKVHHAFGSLVADARAVFGTVRGHDLAPYVKRFETRDRKVRVPSLEHGKLRPYQRAGVAWMLSLAAWAPGCVLADDMGLGKTVQTAAVLKARASLGPALIVAPASVSSNWLVELARFMPSLRVKWFNDDREIAPADLGPNDVLVVSYGLLQRCVDLFKVPRWATVVVDEAQYVKNLLALRTDAIRNLQRDFTIALTGTPLENHLGELFSIMDLVFPSLLGTEATFRERFRRPIEGGRDGTRLAVLGRLLSPFLLRRTRASVLDDLPPREEITETIDLGPEETKRYLALRRACELQFAKRKKGETAAQLKIALFAALTRLRQLACDARLVDPTFTGKSTKIVRVVELCSALAAEGNRALVFSSFTQFLEKIRGELTAAGLRVAYLAGDVPATKRRPIIDAFQAGEYDVFCVSLLAGGTGLNLTKASYVIHTDPWWNPAAEEQATSRAHRIGQKDPVTVYRLVARGTIEEAVLDMHASKRELAAAVLEGKASAKSISADQLLELLRFGTN
ncbi:MAG: DEAD/DEAH box helicase [Labilithrix sp.]|nr:DEAD/DEAH box helicase [Labilithrix sp.]